MDQRYQPRTDSPLLGASLRLPPANIEAEQALLGAIMSNSIAYDRVASFLTPAHFADPINVRIFHAIQRRIEAGLIADAVALKAEFENSGVLDDVGGTRYLAQLMSAMVGIINATEYGRAIYDCWLRRELIRVGTAMVESAFGIDEAVDGAATATRAADDIDLLVSQASPGTVQRRGNVQFADAVHEVIDRMEDVAAGRVGRLISTGLPCLDRVMGGGIGPNTLNYMVGASEGGKTELALQIAEGVAANARQGWLDQGTKGMCPCVLYICLGDMTAQQMATRSAARLAAVPRRVIARGDADMDQAERVLIARNAAAEIPIEFSDTGASTVGRVLGDIRRVQSRRPVALVIVDNFSDFLSVAPHQMFGTAVASAKALKDQGAKDMNVCILVLMHTNSSREKDAKGARPTPQDIPWNTKIHAHFAFGVYRPFLYLDPSPPEEPDTLNDKGREVLAKIRRKWAEARDPYPNGVRNVTEIIPMKMREADDDGRDIGILTFDRLANRFHDMGPKNDQRNQY